MAPLPEWLDPDFHEVLTPLRAKWLRRGAVYASEDGAPLTQSESTMREHPAILYVVEAPATRESQRVRVLCATPYDRLHVFVERADLASVTRHGAVLAARQHDLSSTASRSQMSSVVVFRAGIELSGSVLEPPNVLRVSYEGLGIRAQGFMLTDHIDHVYEANLRLDSLSPNGKVKAGAQVFDAPRGQEYARLTGAANQEWGALDAKEYRVETMGRPLWGAFLHPGRNPRWYRQRLDFAIPLDVPEVLNAAPHHGGDRPP